MNRTSGVAVKPELAPWLAAIMPERHGSGIYFVWAKDRLIYIGTSLCLYSRLSGHPYKRRFIEEGVTRVTTARLFPVDWDARYSKRMRMVQKNIARRTELESWLIREFQPELNVRCKKVAV